MLLDFCFVLVSLVVIQHGLCTSIALNYEYLQYIQFYAANPELISKPPEIVFLLCWRIYSDILPFRYFRPEKLFKNEWSKPYRGQNSLKCIKKAFQFLANFQYFSLP